MPNIIVTVSELFGMDQYGICFRNSNGVLSLKCKEHPATFPFKGAELNATDIAKLMRFFLDSLGDDDEKGNLERLEECDAP